MKTKLVLIVIVAVLAVSTGVLQVSSHPSGGSSLNEKIEIPQGGATVTGARTGALTYTLAVHNVGLVEVTIATIYVDGIAYAYSSTGTLGTFSASTNRISPGQSVTFRIATTVFVSSEAFASPLPIVYFRAVTTNGAQATAEIPNAPF